MAQRTAGPILNDLADQPETARYELLRVHTRAFCLKASAWCFLLAVICVYYVHAYKGLKSPTVPDSSKAPTVWKYITVLGSRNRTKYYLAPYNRRPTTSEQHFVNTSSLGEFKLEYKKLFVFSRTRQIVGSAKHRNSSSETSGRGVTGFTPYLHSDGDSFSFGDDPCAGFGVPNSHMFECSELLPSVHNIFFLETSCASGLDPQKGGDPTLSEKIACSIYSATHHNPARKVILLFTCPFPKGYEWTKDWLILFTARNFFFSRVNLSEFYANTPLSGFYHGQLAKSSYPVEHQADLFRLVVLYFYGGTYLDIDHITLRSLDDLGFNFISNHGPNNSQALSNSGMNFEPNHQLLRACLFIAMKTYVPQQWNGIGPLLLTKTVKSRCKVSGDLPHLTFTKLASCNITILPDYIFYAVDWPEWKYFYQPRNWSYVESKLDKSYGAHYWNHLGRSAPLFAGSRQPIIMLAKRHCSPIYVSAGAILSKRSVNTFRVE